MGGCSSPGAATAGHGDPVTTTGQHLRWPTPQTEPVTPVDLQTYLREDEAVLERVEATLRSVGAVDGTLAATPSRVVFVAEGLVADVDATEVTAIEFRDARYPLWNAVIGVVLAVLGAFLLAVAYTGAGRPVTTWFGAGLLLVGAVTLALGLRERTASLELYTPAKSFEFAGDGEDLAQLPAAIRHPDERSTAGGGDRGEVDNGP
jgi:hypothetical protein